jgi:hypothetical protein
MEMSYQIQRKKYRDPYAILQIDSHDEDAWRQLFGDELDKQVCTVVIREHWDYKLYGTYSKSYRETEDYEREVYAYC